MNEPIEWVSADENHTCECSGKLENTWDLNTLLKGRMGGKCNSLRAISSSAQDQERSLGCGSDRMRAFATGPNVWFMTPPFKTEESHSGYDYHQCATSHNQTHDEASCWMLFLLGWAS